MQKINRKPYTLNRRKFLGYSATLAGFFLTPVSQEVWAAKNTSTLMGFASIPTSTADTVTLPPGYKFEVVMSWGDPIFTDAPEFDPSGKASAADQKQQFGDNTDGMSFFAQSDNQGLLAVNNEYINPEHMFEHKGEKMTLEDVKKSQAAHGVTIVELKKTDQGWQIDKTGKLNRRITANTPMEITGPAAGNDMLKTKVDPSGTRISGTIANCANGQTPWGTYLTCEENFNKYFGVGTNDTTEISPSYKRYGIEPDNDNYYQWSHFDPRFDFSQNPNEPNRFGWIVEIDPFDPDSTPRKHTALGRFKHENAALVLDNSGHVVVYMGDDEHGEHLYKFVSEHKYNPDDKESNAKLLTAGTLYTAKFASAGDDIKSKGLWLELTHGKNGLTAVNGFHSQAEILINTRLAATVAGATSMDRPEWVAVHPDKSTVFCTLTNNKYRGEKEDQPLNGPNSRANNKYGQILRWSPDNYDHSAKTFTWDLFVLAGNPLVHKDIYAGSSNITKDNMFNSPDGIGFDNAGRLWIQTDGKYSNKDDFAGMGNNQMLCADPATGEIRRFMTGPVACEITGLAFSRDYQTMFVGIQHPGEKDNISHFPEGGNSKPRSSVIAISKKAGGIIGT